MAYKTFIIGRNPNVTSGEIPILINDSTKKVSSNHCRISYDGANYFIEDLISTNGTFVDGARINMQTRLNGYNAITLGKSFNFSLHHPDIQRVTKTKDNEYNKQNYNVNQTSDNIQVTNEEPKLYIQGSIAKNLPSMVKNELAKLSPNKQEEFIEEYKRKIKSLGTAYFLMFFLVIPYGYLKKWGLQFVFWFTGFGIGLWWFILLFMLPSLVKEYNKDMAIEVMRNLKATSS